MLVWGVLNIIRYVLSAVRIAVRTVDIFSKNSYYIYKRATAHKVWFSSLDLLLPYPSSPKSRDRVIFIYADSLKLVVCHLILHVYNDIDF